ncbi:hypothetical protein [Actinoplanes sp. NPDC026619]|uniref:hypothetical protein n=1 Tax=Actinoplanes sp. NPDC026619 TaxID=3155798 RepID=UPI003404130C
MKTQLTALTLAAATLGILAGCTPDDTKAGPATVPAGAEVTATPTDSTSADSSSDGATTTATPKSSRTTTSPAKSKTTQPAPKKSTASGPTISFQLVQKPKCPEGTAVFRAPAVPAIIKWKITGADSAALSVDDPTNTPGTYGPEPLSGTETFQFTCAGDVGTVEKHTYAIWSVGGGTQHKKTIIATAKILDNGKS